MHSKVMNIKYTALETQGYITSPIFTDKEVSMLFALRSECLRECKANFKSQFKHDYEIICSLCTEKKLDDQRHMLKCKELSKEMNNKELIKDKIEYSDMYGDVMKQKVITALYTQLVKIKQSKINPSTLQNNNCDVLK